MGAYRARNVVRIGYIIPSRNQRYSAAVATTGSRDVHSQAVCVVYYVKDYVIVKSEE
jgi:uncharacterized protein YlxP (DUF503 family)